MSLSRLSARRRTALLLCLALLLGGVFWYRHHFTPARWAALHNRGNLVGSLLRQYDGLTGLDESALDSLLGHVDTEAWRGESRRCYWIGGGRGLEWFPEYMILYLHPDGTVSRVEYEWA